MKVGEDLGKEWECGPWQSAWRTGLEGEGLGCWERSQLVGWPGKVEVATFLAMEQQSCVLARGPEGQAVGLRQGANMCSSAHSRNV